MPIDPNQEDYSSAAYQSTLPSNAIDRMISMSVLDYHPDDENDSRDQRIQAIYKKLSFKRKRLQSIRSHVSTIGRLTWNNTGPKQIERAEMKIFETLSNPVQGRFIPVRNGSERIWTISANLTSPNVPIVLIHGFGGGLALWSLNLDELSANRPVYALDLPGFARSSRPIFSLDHRQAEDEFVQMFEDWRIAVGLKEQFIFLGHSFGGFLSAAYALRYPQWIKQLILVDPWGFGRRPEDIWQTGRLQKIPSWLRSFSSVFMKWSPLTGLRIAGPLGIPVIKYFRADLRGKFEKLFHDDRILIYLYHCNAQSPTGEQAFRTMSDCFAWAKDPMIDRIDQLDPKIPIYFLHGEQSWISPESSYIIQEKRNNVFIEAIPEAGHHIYADAPEKFDQYLRSILINQSS